VFLQEHFVNLVKVFLQEQISQLRPGKRAESSRFLRDR
jgi:hypothetical protein